MYKRNESFRINIMIQILRLEAVRNSSE